MRLFILFLAPLAAALAADPFVARVVQVADGDTITVEVSGHLSRVRLFGIDCPEKAQEGGEQAKWFTTNAAMHRTVTMIAFGTDRYGQ